jgi:CRISPR-associated protein Cas5d
MKVERVSYEVMTPSAARGILEAIYWKHAIRWVVKRIHVLKPITVTNVRRNELGSKIKTGTVKKIMKNGGPLSVYIEQDRQQRAALVLKDVDYLIEAEFEYTSQEDNNDGKHLDIFNRRAAKGQCFHRPYLGCREFAAHFEPQQGEAPASPLKGERDLGWMLWDLDYSNPSNITPAFFHAKLSNGVLEVPPPGSQEVRQ